MENVREGFLKPAAEFGPIPFWFWNDDLDKAEIEKQITAFLEKGIHGFVIHPRKGLTEAYRYLSEPFMDAVAFAVEEAAERDMVVYLYDEAMYPSGAANGKVVEANPGFASKGLQMNVLETDAQPVFGDGNELVAVVCNWEDQAKSFTSWEEAVAFQKACQAPCRLTYFTMVYTKGHIRGVHPGEDDEEPNAPKSADLLDREAVQTFIHITYDAYWDRLQKHFGKTVQAIFTDEPSILGRGPLPGLIGWTHGMLEDYLNCGGKTEELALLFDANAQQSEAKKAYDRAIIARLDRNYFGQLSQWCVDHGIALTGHPHSSMDIGHLKHFQLPCQDMVWRFVDPLKGTGLTGHHSTMGKCSADSARHRGARRNGNECFGACGRSDDPWNLPGEDIKWYLDWLFVRGVNLIIPHAFFFSLRGDRGDERPPDVGMNSIWWKDYTRCSDYIKRMCYLQTDCHNLTDVAVLCTDTILPWEPVQELYRNQIEFNYLEAELAKEGTLDQGALQMAQQRYRVILVDQNLPLTEEHQQMLSRCQAAGVAVCDIREVDLKWLKDHYDPYGLRTNYPVPDLRVTHVKKDGVLCYVMTNEGEEPLYFHGFLPVAGQMELWDPWMGTVTPLAANRVLPMSLGFRESIVLVIKPAISQEVTLAPVGQVDAKTLGYEATITLSEAGVLGPVEIVHNGEQARLWLDGQELGIRMWKPYVFPGGETLTKGTHTLRVDVTAGLSSKPVEESPVVRYQII